MTELLQWGGVTMTGPLLWASGGGGRGQSQVVKSGIIPLEENCSVFFMVFQMFHQTFNKFFV